MHRDIDEHGGIIIAKTKLKNDQIQIIKLYNLHGKDTGSILIDDFFGVKESKVIKNYCIDVFNSGNSQIYNFSIPKNSILKNMSCFFFPVKFKDKVKSVYFIINESVNYQYFFEQADELINDIRDQISHGIRSFVARIFGLTQVIVNDYDSLNKSEIFAFIVIIKNESEKLLMMFSLMESQISYYKLKHFSISNINDLMIKDLKTHILDLISQSIPVLSFPEFSTDRFKILKEKIDQIIQEIK